VEFLCTLNKQNITKINLHGCNGGINARGPHCASMWQHWTAWAWTLIIKTINLWQPLTFCFAQGKLLGNSMTTVWHQQHQSCTNECSLLALQLENCNLIYAKCRAASRRCLVEGSCTGGIVICQPKNLNCSLDMQVWSIGLVSKKSTCSSVSGGVRGRTFEQCKRLVKTPRCCSLLQQFLHFHQVLEGVKTFKMTIIF